MFEVRMRLDREGREETRIFADKLDFKLQVLDESVDMIRNS
jgi:hypothetical protein